jgi:hypothetical protein
MNAHMINVEVLFFSMIERRRKSRGRPNAAPRI